MSTNATMYEKSRIDTEGKGLSKGASTPEGYEHASNTNIDLNSNVGAKLRNPLAGIGRETLMANVEEFARQKNLEHALPALKKGAILAQSPVSPKHRLSAALADLFCRASSNQ